MNWVAAFPSSFGGMYVMLAKPVLYRLFIGKQDLEIQSETFCSTYFVCPVL